MMHEFFRCNCRHRETLLWEYAAGRLSAEQNAHIAAHLADCAACRTQLRTVTQIGQGLEKLRQAPVPVTQTHWAEMQARLADLPTLPQPVTAVRSAGRYRVLAGAGMAAAMALLWIALVPQSREQRLSSVSKVEERSAKPRGDDTGFDTKSGDPMAKMEARIFFTKSLWPEDEKGIASYHTGPIAPAVRLSPAAFSDTGTTRKRFAALWRGGRQIRRYGAARRHQFALARNEMTPGNTLENRMENRMETGTIVPVVGYALTPVTTNYVLTDVTEEEAPRAPRSYVMDCLTTETRNRANEETNRNGEERVW